MASAGSAISSDVSLDDIRQVVGQSLDERLGPVAKMVDQHQIWLGEDQKNIKNIGARLEVVEKTIARHAPKVEAMSGDSLGGALFRWGFAAMAFVVMFLSEGAFANAWFTGRAVLLALAAAFVAYAIVGLMQLKFHNTPPDGNQPNPGNPTL